MRATIIHGAGAGAGDVRVETVPDSKILEPTDAVVRVVSACICGSDLWPYRSMPASEQGARIGHEFLGIVEDTGSDVEGFKSGELVVAPFVWSDGTCDFCHQGLQTSCRHGGMWARDGIDGGQGEAVRVPQAAGTLVKLPVGEDSALLASLLSLSDVFPTGYHCARTAGANPRTTVTVIGDGAVGLSAVLSAKRLGAERVRELTGGDGTHTVLECVGLIEAIETAFGVVRDGGTVSRVGAPQYDQVPMDFGVFMRNVTLTGGVAPARAYIPELLPDVLEGRIQPGKVFDQTLALDDVAAGYEAMADRTALKVLVRP